MSYAKLPDRMVGYATYELAELLAKLTQAQRAAIDRIVEHVYINNRPWAILFRDQPAIPSAIDAQTGAMVPGRPEIKKICAESNYYRRGKVDPETGERGGGGWGHDEGFIAALKKATELALATQERERSAKLQAAKSYAEDNARAAVVTWVGVMESSKVDFARIEAASKVLDLAFRGEGDDNAQSTGRALERDWWAAADGDLDE